MSASSNVAEKVIAAGSIIFHITENTELVKEKVYPYQIMRKHVYMF